MSAPYILLILSKEIMKSNTENSGRKPYPW